MLNIYFKGEDNEIIRKCAIIDDVENEVYVKGIPDNDTAKKLIQKIEKGKYLDNSSFIDRFGYKLYLDSMSTGCKAAMVVVANNDKIVDLKECGWNARDEIIKNCKDGNILIEDNGISYGFSNEEKDIPIDVKLDRYRFKNIYSLNWYVRDREYNEDLNEYFLNKSTLYDGMEEL